ncbi:MAG: DUF192 domain-containing protein [Candidatus Azambacteria bacterium]|nr:DUF192 domain-containing protein [Candidatus Azambacteria bacterium]
MKTKMFLAILSFFLLLLIIFAGIFLYVLKNKTALSQANYTSVCFSGRCFNAEVASSFYARMKGLMYREFLADDAGMLFVFQGEDKYSFWMKNTLISLDMVWINKNKEIVYIAKKVQPCKSLICPSVSPDRPALYILEINGGKADEVGLKIGDKAEF